MRKDVIVKLAEHGRLNQSRLLSYCGLNLAKHKGILDDLEAKGIITKEVRMRGEQKIITYAVTGKGMDFCTMILNPYEEMFPRRDGNNVN